MIIFGIGITLGEGELEEALLGSVVFTVRTILGLEAWFFPVFVSLPLPLPSGGTDGGGERGIGGWEFRLPWSSECAISGQDRRQLSRWSEWKPAVISYWNSVFLYLLNLMLRNVFTARKVLCRKRHYSRWKKR